MSLSPRAQALVHIEEEVGQSTNIMCCTPSQMLDSPLMADETSSSALRGRRSCRRDAARMLMTVRLSSRLLSDSNKGIGSAAPIRAVIQCMKHMHVLQRTPCTAAASRRRCRYV